MHVPAFLSQISSNREGDKSGFDATFSFYMTKGSSGNLVFGGYDLAKYTKSGSSESSIFWSSSEGSSKYWQVEVQDIKLGSTTLLGSPSNENSIYGKGKVG